jgi:hypothetical protein
MPKTRYKLRAKVWLYPGHQAAWHFVTLPKNESGEIKKTFGAKAKGWRSLPVKVTIGKTSWNTSIFPDTKSNAYLLPLKADVRKKEKIAQGDEIAFQIEIKL